VKWILVNRRDEIVDSCEIASQVGVSGARTYFKGIKQMQDDKAFDSLWKVMSRAEYDRILEMGLRKPSSHGQVEWWKEDKEIIDEELGS